MLWLTIKKVSSEGSSGTNEGQQTGKTEKLAIRVKLKHEHQVGANKCTIIMQLLLTFQDQ